MSCMSLQKKLAMNSMCLQGLSVGGLKLAKSSTSRPQADTLGMTFLPSGRKTQGKTTYIAEFLQRNKQTILKDKSIVSLQPTRDTKSSKTSGQASTSSETVYENYFNESIKDMYERLWLPRETDCVDSPLISSSGHVESLIARSRFTSKKILAANKNSRTTSCLLSKYFVAAETAQEDTPVVQRTKKIRIKPTMTQKKLLGRYARHHRFTYNACVAHYRDGRYGSKYDMRNTYVTDRMIVEHVHINLNVSPNGHVNVSHWVSKERPQVPFLRDNSFLKETPKVIRQDAAFLAATMFKSAMSNLKAGNIKHFQMNYLRGKSNTWSMGIEKFYKFDKGNKHRLQVGLGIGTLKLREQKWQQLDIHQEVRIMKTNTNKYYLLVPYKKSIATETYDDRPIAGIDPGVNPCWAVYADNQEAYMIGTDWKHEGRKDFQEKIHALQSQVDKAEHADQRRRLKRRINLLREKLKNVRKDFHEKTAKFLSMKYSAILFGDLDSHQMARASDNQKTNDDLMCVSHGAFKTILIRKCQETHSRFMLVDEKYTTRTCGQCGTINHNVGSSKLFQCPICGLQAHRDVHAARNMLIKHMAILPVW